MKYNEKTGRKIPENRRDEVQLSMEEIKKLYKDTNGMADQHIEHGILLRDIDISLALIVDMFAHIYNITIKKAGEANGQSNGVDCSAIEHHSIEHDTDERSEGHSD